MSAHVRKAESTMIRGAEMAAMTFEEIAQQLGLSKSSVAGAYRSGMRKLRQCHPTALVELKQLMGSVNAERNARLRNKNNKRLTKLTLEGAN